MAVVKIDQFLDSLSEEWMQNVFVDRLESARLLLDDETFGNKQGANDVLLAFLKLGETERSNEIERLRVRNQVRQWAKRGTTSASDLNAIITALREIRDAKNAQTDGGENDSTESSEQ